MKVEAHARVEAPTGESMNRPPCSSAESLYTAGTGTPVSRR